MSGLAGIVLAAGISSRFGADNKLLADYGGQAMVRGVVEAALAADLEPVIVVTGHEADDVRQALSGLDVDFAHNADFATGQAGSLKTGIAAVPQACTGAMILLADMPAVNVAIINRLVGEFADEACIVVPRHEGKRGNPVILGRGTFAGLEKTSGDRGARNLLAGDNVRMIDIDTDAVLRDFDTPESLQDH
ncbi:nucleotidyltransferase family protein [Anderseniella sp. Alg231-50]|uniref:nucleotidyltransferase family protein n=1 Tax=Anderseniella sp. Alg231-50 TaxID=1922226 RepID=UPI00307B3693